MKWLTWAATAATVVLLVDDARLRVLAAREEEKLTRERELAKQRDDVVRSYFVSLYSCRDTVEALSTHTQHLVEAQAKSGPGLRALARDWREKRRVLTLSVAAELKEIRDVTALATRAGGP